MAKYKVTMSVTGKLSKNREERTDPITVDIETPTEHTDDSYKQAALAAKTMSHELVEQGVFSDFIEDTLKFVTVSVKLAEDYTSPLGADSREIEVSDEVYEILKKDRHEGETPNDVIRRKLGMPPKE